jgi:hypothetical protein
MNNAVLVAAAAVAVVALLLLTLELAAAMGRRRRRRERALRLRRQAQQEERLGRLLVRRELDDLRRRDMAAVDFPDTLKSPAPPKRPGHGTGGTSSHATSILRGRP